MKKPSVEDLSLAISDELRAYLDALPVFTDGDKAVLEKAAEELEDDPEFQADLLKTHFAEQVMQRMNFLGISRSKLAGLWRKTRQYVSRILDTQKPKNFTLQTAAELARLLDCRVEICLVQREQTFHVMGYQTLDRMRGPLIARCVLVASDCGEFSEKFQGFESRKSSRATAAENESFALAA